MTRSSANRFKGFTLAEIIVSLALTSLLLVSLAQLMNSCWNYLRQTTLTTELQQACVIATSRLVTELLEGDGVSIRGDSTQHRYVSFGSARNAKGETTFSPAGDLEWHSYTGYYIMPDGADWVIYRKEKPLDGGPQDFPPTIPNDYDEIYWNGLNASRSLVAKRVYYLDVVSSTTVDVILGAKSSDNQFMVNIKTKLKARN